MKSVKFPRVSEKLLATGVIGILCVSLSGCVSDDGSDVATLKPFGGSKQHPIVIRNGKASVAECGDWSENLASTEQNTFAPNHGCAVQNNIAAQAAYAEDLAGGNRQLPPPDGDIASNAIQNLKAPPKN